MKEAEERRCKNCNCFRQHYIWRNGYMQIEAGHCVHRPRIRQCRPEMKACEKWQPQDEMYCQTYLPKEDKWSGFLIFAIVKDD